MMIKPKKELLEVTLVVIVVVIGIFLAKFPVLYNALHTPPGYWFPKQTSWFDAWDINAYVSYMRYGQQSGVILKNTYTTIPHQGVFVFPFYTILGVINRLFRLDTFVVFHFASVITSILLILSCYFVARTFIEQRFPRMLAFVTMVLGGGFGWLPFLHGSADYTIAGFTLVNALERGHDAASTLALLLCLTCMYLFVKTNQRQYILGAVVAGSISLLIHPPLLAVICVVGLMVTVWQFQKKASTSVVIMPLLLVGILSIYYIVFFRTLLTNSGFSGIGRTPTTISIPIILYGFGLLSFFIIWEFVGSSRVDLRRFFLRVVFLTQLFLLFTPFSSNLYFAKGLFIWGVLLSLDGIQEFFPATKIQMIVLFFIVSTSLLTRVYIFQFLMHPTVENSFYFLTTEEGTALTFLSQLPPKQSVLSLYRIGNYIPAFSDARVYFGHYFLTPGGNETLRLAQNIYLTNDFSYQKKFIEVNAIDYIYYGLEEVKLRKTFQLATNNPFPQFPIVYQNGSVVIYRAR